MQNATRRAERASEPYFGLQSESKIELAVPSVFDHCGGISIAGKVLRSFLFSTDVVVIRNCNADAVLCVYPFMCQASINDALIKVSDKPVFTGVAGGITTGLRSVEMALAAQESGAWGIVANMMTPLETIAQLRNAVDIPLILTVSVLDDDTRARIEAGADIVNVAAGHKTAQQVARFRQEYPNLPIMATSGRHSESALKTIEAGADALSWTPPSIQDTEHQVMLGHRIRANA